MSRLIDADKLKAWFPHDSDWDYPVNTNSYVSGLIDEQLTVDAIPVQWIKQFIFLHPDSTAQIIELVDEWRRKQQQEAVEVLKAIKVEEDPKLPVEQVIDRLCDLGLAQARDQKL